MSFFGKKKEETKKPPPEPAYDTLDTETEVIYESEEEEIEEYENEFNDPKQRKSLKMESTNTNAKSAKE